KIQAVEIGKNNRIEQTPIHDLNLPANPHGYWLFGSLDFQSGNMISSQPRYDHFDTSPYCILKGLWVSAWLGTAQFDHTLSAIGPPGRENAIRIPDNGKKIKFFGAKI
ncbi:MAG: hypothetical protein SOZ47_08700, partial [Lawsonibacter sp.]|nr:hypothetical protein [Lawsonibacter sp.]